MAWIVSEVQFDGTVCVCVNSSNVTVGHLYAQLHNCDTHAHTHTHTHTKVLREDATLLKTRLKERDEEFKEMEHAYVSIKALHVQVVFVHVCKVGCS